MNESTREKQLRNELKDIASWEITGQLLLMLISSDTKKRANRPTLQVSSKKPESLLDALDGIVIQCPAVFPVARRSHAISAATRTRADHTLLGYLHYFPCTKACQILRY